MGRALWEGPGGEQDVSARRGQRFPSRSPRATQEGSEAPVAASPRGGWRARDRSGSGEDPAAWPQESSHSPRHSPAFTARMDNSPPTNPSRISAEGATRPLSALGTRPCQRQLRQKPLATPDAGAPACVSAQLCCPRGHLPLHCITPMGCGQQMQRLCTQHLPAAIAQQHPYVGTSHCPLCHGPSASDGQRVTATWGHSPARPFAWGST